MGTRADAIKAIRAWAGGNASPVNDAMESKQYALTEKQAEGLWALASKQSGTPLSTNTPLPR